MDNLHKPLNFVPALTIARVLPVVLCAVLQMVSPVYAADMNPSDPGKKYDWSWVKGVVFVPTNCVNEAQQWDQYDPAINDRELHYAAVYGFNCVRAYLHYDIYLKNKQKLLDNIEDFLTRADRHGIKTEFVFFDDCWNQPPRELLSADYVYPAPLQGVHNSRWLVCPGDAVKKNYDQHKERLKSYVQDIVIAHKSDPRIAFWETYNEPNNSPETRRLLEDSLAWIRETGSKIPVTATGGQFAGEPWSDFLSWHCYDAIIPAHDSQTLCTECMNRQNQSVPQVVQAMGGHTGYMFWELGIGRDNCRFSWQENREHPRKDETPKPFHGLIYPDGHPWSVEDVKAVMGEAAFAKAPLFSVQYFKDGDFKELAKTSVTPMIDFDLVKEEGVGSPDASAGVPRENFSIRWSGTIQSTKAGSYRIEADGDGSIGIAIDGKKIIEDSDPGHRQIGATLDLAAHHSYRIEISYSHASGPAGLHIHWSGPQMPRQVLLPAAPDHE